MNWNWQSIDTYITLHHAYYFPWSLSIIVYLPSLRHVKISKILPFQHKTCLPCNKIQSEWCVLSADWFPLTSWTAFKHLKSKIPMPILEWICPWFLQPYVSLRKFNPSVFDSFTLKSSKHQPFRAIWYPWRLLRLLSHPLEH